MTTPRAVGLAVLVAVVAGVTAVGAAGVPVHWAVLIAVPAGALALAGALLSGTFDAEWEALPEPQAAGVALHATFLTERLDNAATDPYRFTSRVQPRLRRIAQAALREDLDSPAARERLGPDLHHLLTAPDAELPPPPTFAALVRRLEELC